jgi:hypothetical protein
VKVMAEEKILQFNDACKEQLEGNASSIVVLDNSDHGGQLQHFVLIDG